MVNKKNEQQTSCRSDTDPTVGRLSGWLSDLSKVLDSCRTSTNKLKPPVSFVCADSSSLSQSSLSNKKINDDELMIDTSSQRGRSMMGRFFEKRGISSADVPGAIVLYNGMLWTQWLGIMVLSVKYRPMRRLYKSPTVSRFHKRMHRKYHTYARLETYFHKQAERVSQWKWLQTLVTKYLKIYDFRSLPYAVLEGTVLYNVMLFPVLFPLNFLLTIQTISLYRRYRANPDSSEMNDNSEGNKSADKSKKREKSKKGRRGSDTGGGSSDDGSPPVSSEPSSSSSSNHSSNSNAKSRNELRITHELKCLPWTKELSNSSPSSSSLLIHSDCNVGLILRSKVLNKAAWFSPDFVLDQYCRYICFGQSELASHS